MKTIAKLFLGVLLSVAFGAGALAIPNFRQTLQMLSPHAIEVVEEIEMEEEQALTDNEIGSSSISL